MRAAAPELQADLAASGAESRVVEGGELSLHALDFGGDGRPLLVLPGITSPAITWEFVARRLAPRVRPVVMDLRGRGLSTTRGDISHSLTAYAADAALVVDRLELGSPVVLGHSFGARIAAALAVDHPGSSGPALLVDPPLTGPGRDPYPTSLEAFLGQLREAQTGTTAEEVATHWPGWPPRELELRARWLATCDEAAVIETHRGFESEDFLDWWKRVPTPALLVRGEVSPVVTETGAAELAELRPDIPIALVAGAGHMIPWDNLPGFIEVVDGFLVEHAEEPR